MREISKREGGDFEPRTHFDFGSGVGSSVWAAEEVFRRKMNETFCVDTSPEMNDLAKAILLDGKVEDDLSSGVHFRLGLPASNDLAYDLVTMCFTLMELPSSEARLTIVDNLWRKTQEGGFLVLIEEGTNAGFSLIMEARDYLTQVGKMKLPNRGKEVEIRGHLYAPCPHVKPCPRYFNDVIPCNFDVKYQQLAVRGFPEGLVHLNQQGRFSYLIFRKGNRVSDSRGFPRLVHPPIVRQKHAFCRLCTNRAKLEEIYVSKGMESEDRTEAKLLYQHGRRSHSGDQLMIHLEDPDQDGKSYWEKKRERYEKKIGNNNDKNNL